ncbi:MAG: hypothetical protein JXB09_00640 [Deltaproteobacteria bacterium]|nr:hypothetical protein [Deltaproteobacteria bacterium]
MVRRSLSITITTLLFLVATLVQAYDAHVEEVINNPTATYKNAFSINVTLEIWNRVLDNPHLMGQLWEMYGFRPRYKVTKTETGIHVTDPSGITGDIRQVGREDHARTFYAAGAFDHWAVPSFFTADGVVVFEYSRERNILSGEANIFMRGDNGISRVVMKIFSGILTRHINNRVDSSFENIKKIIQDISNDPQKLRDRLDGPLLNDFDKVFPVAKNKPAKGQGMPSDF